MLQYPGRFCVFVTISQHIVNLVYKNVIQYIVIHTEANMVHLITFLRCNKGWSDNRHPEINISHQTLKCALKYQHVILVVFCFRS